MVPLRLRHHQVSTSVPFLYQPHILSLLVAEMHFDHRHRRLCCLNSWGHASGEAVPDEEGATSPAGKHAVKQTGRAGDDDTGCIWVTEPQSSHRPATHSCAMRTRATGRVRGARTQLGTTHAPDCPTGLFHFWGFSGGKAVCAPHLCLGQGHRWTEEGSHTRQVPLSPQISASLQR